MIPRFSNRWNGIAAATGILRHQPEHHTNFRGEGVDVSSLKKDVSSLKKDVSSLKKDVSSLKKDVSSLKKDVSSLKKDVSLLQQNAPSCAAGLTRVHLRPQQEAGEISGPVRAKGLESLEMIRGWLCLSLLLIAAGCSEGTPETDAPPADAPAQRAPAGVSVLPAPAIENDTLQSAALAQAFSELDVEGASVRLIDREGNPLLLIRLALDAYEPVLIGGRPGGVTAADALAEAQVVVGSGFVSHVNSLSPVGLLQIDGEMLSEMQPYGYTRVLGLRSDGLGILGHREFHRGMYPSAVQLGPGIVEQGVLDISERDLDRPRYLRAFVATCGAAALAGVSLRPMHLFTLGQQLLEFFEKAGLVCDEVVNLAGDREALLAMAAPEGDRFAYFGHPQTAKATLIGFRTRDRERATTLRAYGADTR